MANPTTSLYSKIEYMHIILNFSLAVKGSTRRGYARARRALGQFIELLPMMSTEPIG